MDLFKRPEFQDKHNVNRQIKSPEMYILDVFFTEWTEILSGKLNILVTYEKCKIQNLTRHIFSISFYLKAHNTKLRLSCKTISSFKERRFVDKMYEPHYQKKIDAFALFYGFLHKFKFYFKIYKKSYFLK